MWHTFNERTREHCVDGARGASAVSGRVVEENGCYAAHTWLTHALHTLLLHLPEMSFWCAAFQCLPVPLVQHHERSALARHFSSHFEWLDVYIWLLFGNLE